MLRSGLPALAFLLSAAVASADLDTERLLEQVGTKRGIVALLSDSEETPDVAVGLARESELTVYVQTIAPERAQAVREAAAAAGLLGQRVFVDHGAFSSVHLTDNVADAIFVHPAASGTVDEGEVLRTLRPQATAFLGERKLVKPIPEGIDEWTHPYHGPDNNPQSNDKLVKGRFRSQFIAYPKFSPMPEQTVIGGGRIYKAMGHIAHKANQNEMLNTLLCINAYNGTILWKRPLPPGFMIHRNTMIATDDALYMGDHESCKVFDGLTGEMRDQITVDEKLTDGPVWKWMALRDGVLVALVGNPEVSVETRKSARRGLGHWPWGMWKGHDYNDPRTSFGFGRTLVAIDTATKKLLWHYRDDEFLDARAVCMNDESVYLLCPGRFLACVNAADGALRWKNTDKKLLEAIGQDGKAQHYVTGYATTCFMKCNNDYLFFAGPQRAQLAVASARDGELAWVHPDGNLQLVLRDDAIYAAGPQTTGVKLDYATGQTLGSLPTRRACTRATGCADSIFYRTSGGTVRVLTGEEAPTANHIAPMRPPCQDGVLVSNGHLYWGPWMCGCQLSLYGNICLAPAADSQTMDADPLVRADGFDQVEPLAVKSGDWPVFRGDNARSDQARTAVADAVALRWKASLSSSVLSTAPVAAGGLVFVADRSGRVRAISEDGQDVWQAWTAGPVYYAPAVANGRVYVGAADGRVYAFAARTGRFLWSYRVAPRDRWMPVYGKLISTWPVAGGVVEQNGTVYAAAGIAHYDGTYVVALDGVNGELKASNTTSGSLAPQVDGGISMQGNLEIVDGELRFLGGGVYETARYDLDTLKCLNTPRVQVTSQFRTAFYPLYPEYGKYLSLDYTRRDGTTLSHDASYEGNKFTNLVLQAALPPGVPKEQKERARWMRRRGKADQAPKNVWRDKLNRRFTSFVVDDDRLLATGHRDLTPTQPAETPGKPFLLALNVDDGSDAWHHTLPADAVKGGTAVGSDGQIYVVLENGELLCFAPDVSSE